VLKPTSTQLCDIINSSFSLGIVPDQMKIAKVYPLFKSGDRSLVINYRPISTLPAFSKIIEKLVYKRLISYLCDHNILYQYQFGFRPNHDQCRVKTLEALVHSEKRVPQKSS